MRAHEAAAAARDRALAERDAAVAQLKSQPAAPAPAFAERYAPPAPRAPTDPPPSWQRDVDWPRRALAILLLVIALIALAIIVRLL
jgi:hypothetical protein